MLCSFPAYFQLNFFIIKRILTNLTIKDGKKVNSDNLDDASLFAYACHESTDGYIHACSFIYPSMWIRRYYRHLRRLVKIFIGFTSYCCIHLVPRLIHAGIDITQQSVFAHPLEKMNYGLEILLWLKDIGRSRQRPNKEKGEWTEFHIRTRT